MFNCTRRSSKKVKEKVDFRFHFHATQVPHTAWDKLALSVIPVDTGRVTGKTRKVPVRHGQCHWPDTVSETAKLILDTRTLQYDERLYKFVVAKGFSRSGVLGEVIINLAEYVSAACPTSVTLPLRFCYAGTVLHVTIQCLTPKTGSRPSVLQRSSSKQEDLISDEDTDLYGARTPFSQSKSGPLERPSNGKYNMRRHSQIFNNAMGEASRIQPPSPTSSASSTNGHIEKTKSPISYISLSMTPPAQNIKQMDDSTRSFDSVSTSSKPCSCNASSFNCTTQDAHKGIEADSENVEVTLEETHKEALQWKDYAQKLQDEIEMQKEQFTNAKLEFDIEKMSLLADRDRLSFELQQKIFKQDNANKGCGCEEHKHIIQELKEELSFEKEANSNLNTQLWKMRDSNMELLSAVRDLEDSLEMQTKEIQYLLSCKNLDSEGANLKGEEGSTDSSNAGETMDKTIDKIINLDRGEEISINPQLDRTEEDIGEKTPSLKMFISGFLEDLRVVLNALDNQPEAAECQNSTNEGLVFYLQDLVKRSQTLIAELQKKRNDVGTEKLFFQIPKLMMDNIVEEDMIQREKVVSMLNDSAEAQRLLQVESENGAYDTQTKSLHLQEMEAKMLQLEMENGQLESRLKSFLDHEELRKTKMEQLEAQLWEFAEQLDYMHASNENFESVLVAMKTEKEQLEQMAQNTKQESQLGEMNVDLQNQSSQCLSQRLTELEAQVKSMEEEKDAYVLERCVSETLARDLCAQLQTLLHKADDIKLQECQSQNACESRTEQRQDVICHIKELRVLFADLLKARQELEDQIRELQWTCTSLEDRMVKEHGELMATISSLDAEFGQLSRESDQMLSVCNREIEMLVSAIEQHKHKRTPGFFIEENACEIAYLRDELQRLKEQTAALLQENGTLVSQALVDTEKHQAEKMEWCEKIALLQEMLKQSEAEGMTSQCDAPQLETSPVTMELERHTKKDEIGIICELEHIDNMGCNNAGLMTELGNLKEALQNLKTEKINLDSDLRKLNTDHGKLEELNASSEQELLALKAELEQCNMLKCALEEQVTCFQTKLQIECGLGANARNECIQLRKENQDLKCDRRDCNLAMDKLEGELLNLQKRLEADLNSLAIELDSSNQILRERELLLSEKIGGFEVIYKQTHYEMLGELQEAKHAKTALQAKVRKLELEVEAKGAEVQTECLQLRQENEELKCRISECKKQNENATTMLQAEVQNLQNIMAQLEIDLNSRTTELEFLKQEAEEKQVGVQTECLQLRQENEELKCRISECKKQNENATTMLQAEVQNSQNIISQLEIDLNSRTTELEFLKQEAEEKQVGVQTECLQLRQENEELKCRISEWKQNEHATTMLQAEVQNLQNIMAQLEIDLNSRTTELEFLKQEAEEKQVGVQTECLQLRQENEELKCRISECKKQNENATTMLQAEVQNSQNIMTQLEIDLNSRTTELEFLKQEAGEKQVRVQTECLQLIQENEELKCRISEWKQNENATTMLQAEVQNLQNIMAQLEIDLNSRTTELEFLKQEAEEKQVGVQTECLRWRQENEELKCRISEWNKQNENVTMMLQAEVQNLQNILTQLEIDLNSKTTELEFLKQEAGKRQLDKEAFEQGGSNEQQPKSQVEAETQTESEEFQSDIGELKWGQTRKQLELRNRQNQTKKLKTNISFEGVSSKQEFENREASLCEVTETSRGNSELQTVEEEETNETAPSKEIQDMKHRRRRWSPEQDDQEALQNLRVKNTSLEAELNSRALQLNSFIEKSREREAILCEKIVHLEQAKRFHEEEVVSQHDGALNKALAEIEQCKHVKATLEENISRLELQLQTERALETEKDTECARLRQQIEELKLALSAQTNMVTRKEEDVESKALEVESIKQEFQEREALLWKEIEYLEMANEHLAVQQVDSGADQLKQELTRLQTQNSELTRRQYELMSKLSTYELLQLELQRLQEANEQLEQKLLKIKEASLWGDALERLIYLETELAETLETNNMYKLQLQGVFAEQHNVQTAGHAEEIIGSLVSFKKQTSFLESELKEMQERYLSMSMRFAEIQAEREELIMTVKALRCARRGS